VSAQHEAPLDAAEFMKWNEPDSGCVTCGDRVMTIADHRCSLCVGDYLRRCPHCLGDISKIVNREVIRRLRQASWDVSSEWVEGGYLDRWSRWQRVLEARNR